MTKSKRKISWLSALMVSSVCLGTHVGPGFASGTQYAVYQAANGWPGLLVGPILAVLFCAVAMFFMLEGTRVYHMYSYRQITNIEYGRSKALMVICGILRDLSAILGTIVVSASLMATIGAVGTNIFGISYTVSVVIMIAIVVLLVMWGSGVIRKSGLPIAIGIVVIVAYIIIACMPASAAKSLEVFTNVIMYRTWPLALFNIYLHAGQVCSGVGGAAASSEDALKTRRDSVVAVLGFAIPILLLNIGLGWVFVAGYDAGSCTQDLPMLWSLMNLGGGGTVATVIYGILAILAVISTGVGYVQNIVMRVQSTRWSDKVVAKIGKVPWTAIIALVMLTASSILGLFGVYNIVLYGYSIVMNIGMPLYLLDLVLLPIVIHRRALILKEKGIDIKEEIPREHFVKDDKIYIAENVEMGKKMRAAKAAGTDGKK